jgi:hypothetical protein
MANDYVRVYQAMLGGERAHRTGWEAAEAPASVVEPVAAVH